MKGTVMGMKEGSRDSSKYEHKLKMSNYARMERMQHSVPESAKEKFKRKPYQTGGKTDG